MNITFAGFWVRLSMLESYPGYMVELTIPDELDQLTQVWQALKNGLPITDFSDHKTANCRSFRMYIMAKRGVNNVFLQGNVGQDPDVRMMNRD